MSFGQSKEGMGPSALQHSDSTQQRKLPGVVVGTFVVLVLAIFMLLQDTRFPKPKQNYIVARAGVSVKFKDRKKTMPVHMYEASDTNMYTPATLQPSTSTNSGHKLKCCESGMTGYCVHCYNGVPLPLRRNPNAANQATKRSPTGLASFKFKDGDLMPESTRPTVSELMGAKQDLKTSIEDQNVTDRCQRASRSIGGWRSPSMDQIVEAKPHLFERSASENHLTFFENDVMCNNHSWFTAERICTEMCCVTKCLLPVEKATNVPVQAGTPWELGDLTAESAKLFMGPGLKGRIPKSFSSRFLPCLLPGTIISVGAGKHAKDFVQKIHPQIKVPYVLSIGDGDAEIPIEVQEALTEKNSNLKHVFGVNPNPLLAAHPNSRTLPIGLSRWHPQPLYIMQILEARNFSNPFTPRELRQCWQSPSQLNIGDKPGLLMSYMTTKGRGEIAERQRNQARRAACPMGSSHSFVSCPGKISLMDMYHLIDTLGFGLSPEGHGHDCYRTWEYLYLGMIPIVERSNWTGDLYDDLPVIELDSFDITYEQLEDRINGYVSSSAFLEAPFNGWERLFVKYWILASQKAAGRPTVKDPESQKLYSVVYQYSS